MSQFLIKPVRVLLVFLVLLALSLPLSFIIYKFSGILSGQESLFIAGGGVAGLVGWFYPRWYVNDGVLVCFLATFIFSLLASFLVFFLADIFETFLVSMAFLNICLIGSVFAYISVNTGKVCQRGDVTE